MTSSKIARQDSTLLTLIVQATARGADSELVQKYIDLLTLPSSRIRASQILKERREDQAESRLAASA